MMQRIVPFLARALLVLAIGFLGGCDDDGGVLHSTRDVVGSGNLATEDRVVGAFDAVTFASEGSLDITLGAAESLRITTDDNLQQHLIAQVQAGDLSIRTESGIDLIPSSTIEFDLTAVELKRVRHAGVGDVDVTGVTRQDFSMTLVGVGDLEASAIDVGSLDIGHSGVGGIVVSGIARVQDVTLAGVGDYDARHLDSEQATVVCTGTGDVVVQVSDVLHVTIVGDGVVRYIGDPAITTDITGNGRVEKI